MNRNKIRTGIAVLVAIMTISLSAFLYFGKLNWPNNNASAYVIIISNTCLLTLIMIVNEVAKGKK